MFFEFLLAANIVHPEVNEINENNPVIKDIQFIISDTYTKIFSGYLSDSYFKIQANVLIKNTLS